jgi:hypothetical protein
MESFLRTLYIYACIFSDTTLLALGSTKEQHSLGTGEERLG